MNKYTLVPTLATAAALAFAAASASAGGNPPVVNCLNNACFVVQPGAVDSDNDGFTDADEKAYGSDPFDPSSRPTMEWIFESIAYDTLPSFGPEPVIDLITITPDGHAITADLAGLLGGLGHGVPDRLAGAGLTMPGIDLGTIGGTLNWDIHGNDTPSNPAPPGAPNSGLFGYYSDPVTKLGEPVIRGESGGVTSSTRVGNATDQFGTRTMETDVTFSQNGKSIGREFTVTQGKGTSYTSETTIFGADGNVLGSGTGTGETTAEAERNAEDAAKADAKATADAKAAADAKAQAEKDAEAKKDAGEHVDPDADQGVDPGSLTQAEWAHLVAANDGSDHTNKGDTGVDFTETEIVDRVIEIINVNPDADQDAAGGQNGDGPNQGGEAGPDYDPRLPQNPGTSGIR